ncbi:MAG: peroxiredoxin [Wenzhouxiangellaceae bacterium]
MSIQSGDAVPSSMLGVMKEDGPTSIDARDLMGSGRTVLFSVPGAFTPTCSARHLPGYIEQAGALRDKGVDRIVCMAVNDVFVMSAWGKQAGSNDAVIMAADGNGQFAKALGLEMDGSAFGMGLRSQRFAMLVEDGVVKNLWVEAPGEFKVSSAEAVLQQL